MGLASKLAQAEPYSAYKPPGPGGAPGSPYPASTIPPAGTAPGYPGALTPSQSPYQGGHSPQLGAGAPGAPFGAPTAVTPQQIQQFKQSLQQTIAEKRLDAFYPPHAQQRLDEIAARGARSVDMLCQQWRLPREIGADIVKIGLFDVILYIDDSGSMQFEENGERIKDLHLVLERVAFAAGLLDLDGISVRFMNSMPPPQMLEHITSNQQIDTLMAQVTFKGLTPMGTELRNKVLEDVVRKARSNQLPKPVLVITLTDGVPAGEPREAVFDTIKWAHNEVKSTMYGPGAIAFQFAQLGNDVKAREFLGKLDADPVVGHLIDCTSNYENESAEMANAQPPVDLSPTLWIVKLLLGAIDHTYDRKDEKLGAPGAPPYGQPGGYPGQPPYGAPSPYGQPGQYPQAQYGGPPQHGNQAPYAGQYGQQPPPQQPQQQPYGQPPYGQPQYGQQHGQPPYGQPPYGQPQQQARPGQYPPQQGSSYPGGPPTGRY